MAAAVGIGHRHQFDARKTGFSLPLHPGHAGHRQAWWVHAIQARGHQLVARLHIGIGRHEAQFHTGIVGTVAEGHPALSGALVEHRHGNLLVLQQRHFSRQRIHPGHLPQQPTLVNHGGCQGDARQRPPVYRHLARVAVGRFEQHFGLHRGRWQGRPQTREGTQLGVLGL